MALLHADFVEETTTTTGTGTLSLAGATTGHRTFVATIGDANTCVYAIAASDGTFESGIGTVADGSPDTLARTTLLSSSTGSKLDLPAGTHRVYCTFAAEGGAKAYAAQAAMTENGVTSIPGDFLLATSLASIGHNNTIGNPIFTDEYGNFYRGTLPELAAMVVGSSASAFSLPAEGTWVPFDALGIQSDFTAQPAYAAIQLFIQNPSSVATTVNFCVLPEEDPPQEPGIFETLYTASIPANFDGLINITVLVQSVLAGAYYIIWASTPGINPIYMDPALSEHSFTIYSHDYAVASQEEMETGTEAGIRRMSPLRVAQSIAALAAGGSWDGDIADINLDGGTDIGAALADGDLILVDDGAGGTNRKCAMSRVRTYVQLTDVAGESNADNSSVAVNTRITTDISGYSANRTTTLPATFAVGDLVEVYVSVGDDTYAQIIAPAAGDTIDGGTAGAEWSRLFITGEKVRFRGVTANSAWTVDYDGRSTKTLLEATHNGTSGDRQSIGDEVLAALVGATSGAAVWRTIVTSSPFFTQSTGVFWPKQVVPFAFEFVISYATSVDNKSVNIYLQSSENGTDWTNQLLEMIVTRGVYFPKFSYKFTVTPSTSSTRYRLAVYNETAATIYVPATIYGAVGAFLSIRRSL